MKIAIIGAGFAGLASAWHILQLDPESEITIFDMHGAAGEASGIAAGLLHCYNGLHAKLNRFGKEGFDETVKLLEISEKALGEKVFASSGMLRVALVKSQEEDYFTSSQKNSDLQFLTTDECQQMEPLLEPFTGLFIKNAKIVYTKRYLEGLFLACKNLGATLQRVKIQSLEELNAFDHIVVTAGSKTCLLPELKSLNLSLVKGQLLNLEWPKDLPPLKQPLNSHCYLLMSEDNKSCIAGATFERNFSSDLGDKEVAEKEIMPKILKLIPALENAKIISCKSGIRVSTKDHLPLIQSISPKVTVFTGLGSKGLLYHAFYAKKLAQVISQRQGI